MKNPPRSRPSGPAGELQVSRAQGEIPEQARELRRDRLHLEKHGVPVEGAIQIVQYTLDTIECIRLF